MPLSKYFGGHGAQVMADMQKKNGEKDGKSEFYATANKQDQAPSKPAKRKSIGQRMADTTGY